LRNTQWDKATARIIANPNPEYSQPFVGPERKAQLEKERRLAFFASQPYAGYSQGLPPAPPGGMFKVFAEQEKAEWQAREDERLRKEAEKKAYGRRSMNTTKEEPSYGRNPMNRNG